MVLIPGVCVLATAPDLTDQHHTPQAYCHLQPTGRCTCTARGQGITQSHTRLPPSAAKQAPPAICCIVTHLDVHCITTTPADPQQSTYIAGRGETSIQSDVRMCKSWVDQRICQRLRQQVQAQSKQTPGQMLQYCMACPTDLLGMCVLGNSRVAHCAAHRRTDACNKQHAAIKQTDALFQDR